MKQLLEEVFEFTQASIFPELDIKKLDIVGKIL